MADLKSKIAKHKESGAHFMAKGNWEKAKGEFLEVLKLSPNDQYSILKVGDCSAKLGDVDGAIRYYDKVAEMYAREDFLVKAIAVNKLILKLRPDSPRIIDRLSTLYSEKIKYEAPKLSIKGIEKKKEEPYPRTLLFSDLSHEEFMATVDKMKPIDIPEGTLIIREGDKGNSIFIIASGEVSIFREDEDLNELWISNLEEGDFFGEFGFFSESGRIASVKAVSDTTLLELSRQDLESIIKKHPGVKEVLQKFYKERVLDTLLAISPIFYPLGPEQRGMLLKSFTLKAVKKGEVVLREGEVGDNMYFIQSGEVEVSTEKDGSSVFLAKLKPGDFFGEVSVITGKPRTATVKAVSNAKLLEVSKEEIQKVVKVYPEVLDALNKYINKRVEDTIATIMEYKNRKSESGLI